jgi:manganese-dependent inorganic pyrophosphatase
MKPMLVTSYVDPDLDGVAGATAYAEFLRKTGTDAIAGFIGALQDEPSYMFEHFGFVAPTIVPNADDFDAVTLVDTSDPNELEGRVAPEKVTEIIDHRAVNEAAAFPNAKAHIELVGAAATLVAEKFMQSTVAPSKESATLLFAGIISNTLNLKGSMTTDRDRKAVAWLNRVAQLPEDFWRELFMAKSDLAGEKLAHRIESDFAWFVMSGKRVGIAEIEMIGAKKLLDERSGEVIQVLEKLKREMHLDIVFQNTIELEDMKTFLVASDPDTQQLLEKALGVHFTGVVAERPEAIMRKQIVPLLKASLGIVFAQHDVPAY